MSAGFSLSRLQSAGEFTGATELYAVAGTHPILATGDTVVISGTDADSIDDRSVVTQSGNTLITGVIESIAPDLANEELNDANGIPANGVRNVQVITDINAVFEVDVANGPLTAVQVGLNALILDTDAVKTGGLTTSQMKLNATGVNTTATFPFRILRRLRDTAGVLGNRALVRINATTTRPGAAGV